VTTAGAVIGRVATTRRGALPWVLPSTVALLVLIVVPVAFLVYVSLTGYELGFPWSERRFVGLQQYQDLLTGVDPDFRVSVGRSITYALLVTAGSLLVGMGVALLLHRAQRGRMLITLVVIMPLAISHAIGGLMWKLMYNVEFGILNHVLGQLGGIHVNWLGDTTALYAVAVVGIWMGAPFAALFLLAGLESLPLAPFEAARVDGAGAWQVFCHVTVPLLRPVIVVVALFEIIDALKSFGAIYLLTEGGPGDATLVLPLHMYRVGFGYTNLLGRGSAIAMTLIVVTMLFAVPLVRLWRRDDG
jgi:multiple sugar transport system permease protein